MTTRQCFDRSRRLPDWLARFAVTGSLLLATAGCSAEQSEVATKVSDFAPAASPTAPGATKAGMMAGMVRDGTSTTTLATDRSDKPPDAPTLPRKIIYNAQVTLVVESVSTVGDQLAKLVKDAGGYISETDQSSYTRVARTAMWKVRVPVERFETFLAAVSRLGELQRHHVDSQDVTQEFFDTEAHIAVKKEEEKRLLELLAKSTGKLADILAVEKELSRVRGEIEGLQGRLKYLAAYSAMSTVTITASEVRDYVPPVAPSFVEQIKRTFRASFTLLGEFIQGVVLFVVAVVPWLPVIAIVVLPVWLVLRLVRNRLGRG
jgi:Domain of unknown function (DUF4349)